MRMQLGIIAILVVAAVLMMPAMARDVEQGGTFYEGEADLNICTALPSDTVQICNWDDQKNKWDGCSGLSSCNAGSVVGSNGLPAADWYAVTKSHNCSLFDYSINPNGTYVEYFSGSTCNETESRSNFIKIFTILPADEMPTPEPTTTEPTPTQTEDLNEKVAALEANVSEQNATIAALGTQVAGHEVTLEAHEETLETLLATPTPTETVNQTARIEALESQLVEEQAKNTQQQGLLDQIIGFLAGLGFIPS